MTELQNLLAMLDRAEIGYGRRIDHNPRGGAVQIESGENEVEFMVTQFSFDGEGKLTAVSCYPGEVG